MPDTPGTDTVTDAPLLESTICFVVLATVQLVLRCNQPFAAAFQADAFAGSAVACA
jgi:hypothetical protein